MASLYLEVPDLIGCSGSTQCLCFETSYLGGKFRKGGDRYFICMDTACGVNRATGTLFRVKLVNALPITTIDIYDHTNLPTLQNQQHQTQLCCCDQRIEIPFSFQSCRQPCIFNILFLTVSTPYSNRYEASF